MDAGCDRAGCTHRRRGAFSPKGAIGVAQDVGAADGAADGVVGAALGVVGAALGVVGAAVGVVAPGALKGQKPLSVTPGSAHIDSTQCDVCGCHTDQHMP